MCTQTTNTEWHDQPRPGQGHGRRSTARSTSSAPARTCRAPRRSRPSATPAPSPDITFTAAQPGRRRHRDGARRRYADPHRLHRRHDRHWSSAATLGDPRRFVNGGTNGSTAATTTTASRSIPASRSCAPSPTPSTPASTWSRTRSAVTALRLRRHRHNMPGDPVDHHRRQHRHIPDITFTAAQLGQKEITETVPGRLVADPHRLHRRHDRPGHRPLRPAPARLRQRRDRRLRPATRRSASRRCRRASNAPSPTPSTPASTCQGHGRR